ncbi:MAG TPA: T9SS type A sorting domain-containing protein [Rhodothermales bacterium]|nr:T9SS type A sorting domain-containing protein [Rhodothermales bacterium]
MLLFLAVLLVGFATQALAQITITEDDIRAQLSKNVTTTLYQATSLDGLEGMTTTDGLMEFDFRIATYDEGQSFSSDVADCSGDLPGCDDPDLAAANLIYRQTYGDSVGVSFAFLDQGGFYMLGGATRGEYDDTNPGDEDVVIKFSPAALFQKLPTTTDQTWTNTTDMTMNLWFEGLKLKLSEEYTVVGAGRLITPHGQADALMVRGWTTTATDFNGNVIFGDTSYVINFLTKVGLSASLYLDEVGIIIAADYTVPGDLGSGIDDDHDVPASIALDQNFPNPFNPSTTIPFTLKQAGQVSLVVYDLLGREVAQVINELRPAGTYQAVWAAGDLPSGTYLYKLSVDGESMTRMLTLLK